MWLVLIPILLGAGDDLPDQSGGSLRPDPIDQYNHTRLRPRGVHSSVLATPCHEEVVGCQGGRMPDHRCVLLHRRRCRIFRGISVKAAQDANIHDVIEGLPEKYQTFVGDRGVRLSGGEKQRLAIARELFRNPEILILDEATSALDSVSERIIQTNLGKLLGSFTMITVAHRLATVKSADNVLVLDQGRVVEAGTFDELSKKDATLFADMLSVQKL